MRRAWSVAGAAAAGLIGFAAIAAMFGTHILPVHDTGWMLRGTLGPDPVQYWLGWTYFVRSPWSWPPGLNPDYGMEVGSSIFYADSIPLLAFAFKALRGMVEVPQYWGLWLFACGILQGVMAWKLIGLATPHPLPRVAGAALFVLSPIMLARLGWHFALGAHFLLLAALYLCLTRSTPARRLAAWAGLILLASLIHAYLLPMVAGFWMADWLARATAAGRRPAWLAAELPLVPGAGVLGLWLAGFFALRGGFGGTWGGYGHMQMDLLAPFDGQGWSAVIPDLPGPDHLEVGYSYLGLGVMLALLAGLAAHLWRPQPWLRRHWPLLLAVLAMLALAVTHRVSVAGHVLPLFDLPEGAQRAADALRASERFLWPLTYTALTGAIFAMLRAFGPRRAGLALAALALVQMVDLRPGFADKERPFAVGPAVEPLRLQDPFWAEAARRYRIVRLAPTGMQARHWEELAVYAATHRMPTDAVYLARLDPARIRALNAATLARLEQGRHEDGVLYALGDDATLAAARQGLDPARDLLERFDGIWMLAPGWREDPRVAELRR
jgi:hypothetical protein